MSSSDTPDAIQRPLKRSGPRNAGWQCSLFVSHLRLATIYLRRGNNSAAAAAAQDALALLDGIRGRGMHLDPDIVNTRMRHAELIDSMTAARAGGAPALPPGVGSFESPTVAKPAVEPRGDVVARARIMLANNDASAAAALLAEAPPSPGLANARAVCAMRLGHARAAVDLLHPVTLPHGARSPPKTTPDVWIITYATALALAGDPARATRALEWVRDSSHRGVTRLRGALSAWRKSLSWKEEARYRLGDDPPRPVTLDFSSGEL